jgi:putative Holliday junction resolvase
VYVAEFDTDHRGWQILDVRWLGLDVGTKTIGIAVSDAEGVIATPLRTLARHGGTRDLETVAAVARETGAGGLVLGLPLDLAGKEGPSARRVRELGQGLAEHLDCPVRYWDERFSTAQAERALLEGDVKRERRKQLIDQIAAAVILQSFLDSAVGRGAGVPA